MSPVNETGAPSVCTEMPHVQTPLKLGLVKKQL